MQPMMQRDTINDRIKERLTIDDFSREFEGNQGIINVYLDSNGF